MSTASPPAPSEPGAPSEALLGRLGRVTIAATLVLAGGGWWLSGPSLALGVLGGGLLAGVSLRAVGAGVEGLLAGTAAPTAAPTASPYASGGRPAARTARRAVVRLLLLHALLAFLAYAMIARLRLHPIGLLLGASSVVVAASAEALRLVARRGAS